MQSELAVRGSIINAPKYNYLRIAELLKSPIFKTRMRALIELILIPLDTHNSQVDKENRKKILNAHLNYLQTSSEKMHPFAALICNLKKASIFISAVRNKAQQSTVEELYSVENNASIRESIARGASNHDSLAEHQLVASAYIYFGDTARYCSELLMIISSQSTVDSFNHAKIIHLIMLNRNNLLKDGHELQQMLNTEMKQITDTLSMLKIGSVIDSDREMVVINKLQLFTWFDEFKLLARTTWVPLLLEVLTSFPDDAQHINQKIFAFNCLEYLLHNLSYLAG